MFCVLLVGLNYRFVSVIVMFAILTQTVKFNTQICRLSRLIVSVLFSLGAAELHLGHTIEEIPLGKQVYEMTHPTYKYR